MSIFGSNYIYEDDTFTISGDLDMEGNRIIDVQSPADSYDAVNKRYKKAKIRKWRNQKKIPTPKTEVGKNQTNNQVLIP